MKKSIYAFFEKLSIQKKMYLIIVPVMLTLFAAFSIVLQTMLSDLQDSITDKNHQFLSLMKKDIQSELDAMEQAASTLLSNTYVKNYVRSDSTAADKDKLQSQMTRLAYLDLDVPQNSNIASFMIIRSREDFIYTNLNKGLPSQEQAQLAAYIYDYYQNGFPSSYVSLPEDLYEKIYTPCYVLPLADSSTNTSEPWRIGGYLVLFVNRYFLSQIVADYYDSDRSILISDSSNRTVWSSGQEFTIPEFLKTNTGSGNTVLTINGEEMLFLYSHIEDIDWNVSIWIPMSSINAQLSNYNLLYWITSLLVLLLAVVLITVFSRSVTIRLSEMTSVIHQIQEGDMDCRYPVQYQDEISLIGKEFNRMVDQIQTLHIKTAQQELRQREAEILALQSQINPHFLYNSLDCIRSEALVNSDDVVARQILTLSNMFRYTVSPDSQKEMVTFHAEISNLYDYLSMLKFRFKDRYQVNMDIDEELLPFKTLKLVLQPVVENAFTHGIRHMRSGGWVKIRGKLDQEHSCILFVISDNGRGIEPARLESLRRLLQANPLANKNTPFLGLVNINDRLRLAYGHAYGISLESQHGHGTQVILRFPILG